MSDQGHSDLGDRGMGLERLQGWISKKRLRRRSSLRFIDRRLLVILGLLGILSAVQFMREGPSALPRVNAFGGSPSGCNIKGNISLTGERIFHVPGQRYYSETVISTYKGERWFCSQWEAWWAGWRKAKV